MTIFKLPDLGEGLPDAEIHEWFVKEGDTVKTDQPLVSMETAKAVVDVPSPQDGTIVKLFGKAGDIIKTGEPLIEFSQSKDEEKSKKSDDRGTVVGNLEESHETSADEFQVGGSETTNRIKTTPAVKLLAKKHGIDLATITGTGEHGFITKADVERIIGRGNQQFEESKGSHSQHLEQWQGKNERATGVYTPVNEDSSTVSTKQFASAVELGYEPLRGVRRAMLSTMLQSHKEVVPVSIFDEADVENWQQGSDITVKLIRAIIAASAKEPALNAWFDGSQSARKCFQEVNLGLAMDNEDGLFVPVIHHAGKYNDNELREIIDDLKKIVQNRSVPAEKLRGATITLSNFGKFAGKFASPIIVPPMVAILAVGRLYKKVISNNDKIETHKILPLSLSFDHRAVTGGEATRFLGEVIKNLQT